MYVCGQSLQGHSSGVDSVTFDASEGLVAAGAASGTIKLWDLEEAKSKFSSFCWLATPGFYTYRICCFGCICE